MPTTKQRAVSVIAPTTPAAEAVTLPPPEPTYVVTVRLQTGTLDGEQTVTWNDMPESRVRVLLADEVAFIKLPARYSTHPQPESKFLNRDQILEIHVWPAWPYEEPW